MRPTPDKVRLAVFNSLGERVVGARVLELFSGTGAIGLECLSRGAASLVSVEKSDRQLQFIRRNFDLLKMNPSGMELRSQNAFAAIHQLRETGREFDLIVADPPYGPKNLGTRSESFAQRLLDDIHLPYLLAAGGLFVLGHTKRDSLTLVAPWEERRTLKHGDTLMRFLLRVSASELPAKSV